MIVGMSTEKLKASFTCRRPASTSKEAELIGRGIGHTPIYRFGALQTLGQILGLSADEFARPRQEETHDIARCIAKQAGVGRVEDGEFGPAVGFRRQLGATAGRGLCGF